MHEPRTIPQRELRNNVGAVLREVEAGGSVRVTVRGRPVADLIPVRRGRRMVPRSVLEDIVRDAPLDRDFRRDVDDVIGQTVDEP